MYYKINVNAEYKLYNIKNWPQARVNREKLIDYLLMVNRAKISIVLVNIRLLYKINSLQAFPTRTTTVWFISFHGASRISRIWKSFCEEYISDKNFGIPNLKRYNTYNFHIIHIVLSNLMLWCQQSCIGSVGLLLFLHFCWTPLNDSITLTINQFLIKLMFSSSCRYSKSFLSGHLWSIF